MVALFWGGLWGTLIALVLFVAGALTDLFDGRIARQRHMITDLGKLIDPLADKILVISAFVSFVELGIVAAWMVVVIVAREFCVTGLRLIAMSKGRLLAASKSGKHKTVSQMVTIIVILILLVLRECWGLFQLSEQQIQMMDYWFGFVVSVCMVVTVILTVLSGATYLFENADLLKES